jgi:CBS domain-containing protein
MSALRRKPPGDRISAVVAGMKERPLPVIHADAHVDEAIQAMIRSPHSRLVYVVDEEQRVLGTISLGQLIRHALPESREPQIHARSLLGMIAHETAGHIMQPRPVCAREDEAVDDVLRRLIDANLKEFPVIDAQDRIIADLTVVDLLDFLMHEEDNQTPESDVG